VTGEGARHRETDDTGYQKRHPWILSHDPLEVAEDSRHIVAPQVFCAGIQFVRRAVGQTGHSFAAIMQGRSS